MNMEEHRELEDTCVNDKPRHGRPIDEETSTNRRGDDRRGRYNGGDSDLQAVKYLFCLLCF
jgi:hypothetical protein